MNLQIISIRLLGGSWILDMPWYVTLNNTKLSDNRSLDIAVNLPVFMNQEVLDINIL